MKSLLLNMFVLFCISAKCQIVECHQNDSCSFNGIHYIDVEKKLPVLGIDSCLFNIFKIISEKDRNCSYYQPNRSCFWLSSSIQKECHLINIIPIYTDWLDSARYFGVLYFNNAKFICYGDYNDKIFHRLTKDSTTIIYHWANLKTKKDSLEYLSDHIPRILYDGYLPSWIISCNNLKIVINAEICNSPIPNSGVTPIKKRKKMNGTKKS